MLLFIIQTAWKNSDKTGNPEALRKRTDFCISVSIVTWKQYVHPAALPYYAVNILHLILYLQFQVSSKIHNDGAQCTFMSNPSYSYKSEIVTEIRLKSQPKKTKKALPFRTMLLIMHECSWYF